MRRSTSFWRVVMFSSIAAIAIAGCNCNGEPGGQTGDECTTAADCDGNLTCFDGYCVDPAETDVGNGDAFSGGDADDNDESGCVNLCEDQIDCPDREPTALTGTVYAPNGELPVPNAAVYVPNDPIDELPPINTGAVCEQCEEQDLGSPLVGTISDYDGTFRLTDVPVTDEVPIVIRLGQWRRLVTVDLEPQQHGCQETELTAEQTRFPTRQHEDTVHDNIPKTAVSTGWIDAMECVLHQIGIEASEFTRHSEDGRIHLYRANGGVADHELAEACTSGFNFCGTDSCTDRDRNCGDGDEGDMLVENLSHHLYESQDRLNSYDMVIMDCEGSDHTQTQARTDDNLDRIRNYVNSGGRLFASHWAYDWLHQNPELQDSAQWGGAGFGSYTLAYVDNTFPGGETFWDWLQLVDADYPDTGPAGQPQIEITDPRGLAMEVNEDLATRWVYTDASAHQAGYDSEQYLSFNTPIYDDAEDQCGQVSYSAFHVADVDTRSGPAFPDYCASEMRAQEKVLAYMLFDLAACVTEDDTPHIPVECYPLGATCQFDEQCCSETCAIESGDDDGVCITG